MLALASRAEVLQTLGERLRLQRLAQNLTQEALAEMAGLSLGALRKLESSGQSSLETLLKVVFALGLVGELEDLFTLKFQSIAELDRQEIARQRKRAPRRKPSW